MCCAALCIRVRAIVLSPRRKLSAFFGISWRLLLEYNNCQLHVSLGRAGKMLDSQIDYIVIFPLSLNILLLFISFCKRK